MAQPAHKIKQKTLEITCQTQAFGHTLLQKVPSYLSQELYRISEELISASIPQDQVIAIDKLEIDLGCVEAEDWEEEVKRRFRITLKEELEKIRGQLALAPASHLQASSPHPSRLSQVLAYLETGVLPWNAEANFDLKNVIQDLLEGHPEALRQAIASRVSHPQVCLRLIRQLPEALLLQLVNIYAGADFIKYFPVLTETARRASLPASRVYETLWEALLAELRSGSETAFVERVLKKWQTQQGSPDLSFWLNITVPPSGNLSQIIPQVQRKALLDWAAHHPTFLYYEAPYFWPLVQRLFPDDKDWLEHFLDRLQGIGFSPREVQPIIWNHLWLMCPEPLDRNHLLQAVFRDLPKLSSFTSQKRYKFQEVFSQMPISEAQRLYQYWQESSSLDEFLREYFTGANKQKLLLELYPAQASFLNQYLQKLPFSLDQSRDILLEMLWQQRQKTLAVEVLLKTHLNTLLARANLSPQERQTKLEEIIAELSAQLPVFKEIFPKISTPSAPKQTYTRLEMAEYWLRYGVLPWSVQIQQIQQGAWDIKQLVQDFKQKHFQKWQAITSDTDSNPATSSPEKIRQNPDWLIYYLHLFVQEGSLAKLPPVVSTSFLIKSLAQSFPKILQTYLWALNPAERARLEKVEPTLIRQAYQQAERSHKKQLLQQFQQQLRDANPQPYSQEAHSRTSQSESFYIENAGLVLLHPFLARFFQLLELTEGAKFKEAMEQNRAVYLLQYLANKLQTQAEHDLVFNKILVGLPLETVLLPPEEIALTEKELQVSESLLQGAVKNWPILKETSSDNLRVSFLMRPGRLTAEREAWDLQVEQRGIDVLLEHLPWGISMVKLPWMPKLIRVNWG